MNQKYSVNAKGGDLDNVTDRNKELKEGTPLRQSELKDLKSSTKNKVLDEEI